MTFLNMIKVPHVARWLSSKLSQYNTDAHPKSTSHRESFLESMHRVLEF
jgi:hypothetical protein